MRSPDVDFCGYSVPHPSEYKMRVRLQTTGKWGDVWNSLLIQCKEKVTISSTRDVIGKPANQVLEESLGTLVDVCSHIESVFEDAVSRKMSDD